MPAAPGPSQGPFPSISAVALEFDTLVWAVPQAQSTRAIFADGLPVLHAWFHQTAGPGNVSVQLEFADGNLVAPNGPRWQPLIPPYALAVGVPSLVPAALGSRQYRATLTSSGVATVDYRITAAIS